MAGTVPVRDAAGIPAEPRFPMLLFDCPHCDNRLYFENSQCGRCGSAVGYDLGGNRFACVGNGWNYCANAARGACNWLVPADAVSPFCLSCRLNELIPPIDDPVQQRRWADVEKAKRRLVCGLWRLSLPVVPRSRRLPSGRSSLWTLRSAFISSGE